MRNLLCAVFLPLLTFGLTVAFGSEPGKVQIDFVQPEKFTDFRIEGRQENESARIFRDQVSAYLSPILAKRFPGDSLTLTFTDIDLAGRIDPSKTRRLSNVRIDRNVASPLRMYFGFNLTNPQGKTVAKGSTSLVDQDYLYRYSYYSGPNKTSTLFYEKATLNRWISTLRPSGTKVTTAQ